jgi:hypothetical protein
MPSLLTRVFGTLVRTRPAPTQGAPRTGWFGRPSPPPVARQRWSGPTTMDPGQYLSEVEQDIARRRREDRFEWENPQTWSHPPVAVSSSNLAEVAFDENHNLLQIRFVKAGRNSGDTYRYTGVPLAAYEGLMAAPSKGRYHWHYIRCNYSYSDISGRSALRGCETGPGRVGGTSRFGGAGSPLPRKRNRFGF